MNISLPKFIGITDLRNRTREIFDNVREKQEAVVVVRDSKPEAVILPIKEYESIVAEKRKTWNKRLDELTPEITPAVASWLKKKGFNPVKITGDKLLSLLEEDDKSRT